MTGQGAVLAVILACMCVLSHTRLYLDSTGPRGARIDGFPERIGDWQAIATYPPSQREMELLETENILTRIYRDGTRREVAAVLVYDPSGNRKMAHPQEICLVADGLQMVSRSSVEIPGAGVVAERLLMERGSRRTLFYYWYKAGAYHSGSYIGTQSRLALNALTGATAGTALVRLSTAVGAQNESQSDQALQDFAAQLLPELDRLLP